MERNDAVTDLVMPVTKLTIDADKSNANVRSAKTMTTKPKSSSKKEQEVADSWEDESVSSDDGGDDAPASSITPHTQVAGTAAPPPTPITPSYNSTSGVQVSFEGNQASVPYAAASWSGIGSSLASSGPSRRPEKTDAVARRLIAGALGIRPPKQAEEQKAYQNSVREAERKRRDQERAAKKHKEEETERAKRAVWED